MIIRYFNVIIGAQTAPVDGLFFKIMEKAVKSILPSDEQQSAALY